MAAIRTRELTRRFKKKRQDEFVALDAVDLDVEQGQIFGLLGPNGAGKTTLIKILATLLYPNSGTAEVLGIDVARHPRKVRPLINMVSGGETSGYGILTVRENIWMFSQFYGIPGKLAKQRIEQYLERFELARDGDTKINKLSTGMRQKMNLIRGLITDPKVLFLDEPTLGLDVHIAREIRAFMAQWVADDPERTVLLTTHYMAEAEELCRNLAIIDRGRIVVCDTPEQIREDLGASGFYRLALANGRVDQATLQAVEGLADLELVDEDDGRREYKFRLKSEERLSDVFDLCQAKDARILNFSKERPDLEDLFVNIVGRKLDRNE